MLFSKNILFHTSRPYVTTSEINNLVSSSKYFIFFVNAFLLQKNKLYVEGQNNTQFKMNSIRFDSQFLLFNNSIVGAVERKIILNSALHFYCKRYKLHGIVKYIVFSLM